MGKGKDICNFLRQIRQQLADENGIVYHPKECHHEGDCKGTCPKCESEVRYLEQQLSLREKANKALKIVGLAAGVATISTELASCTEGDIEDPNVIEFYYGDMQGYGSLNLKIPKEGGTFHCSCDAEFPNVLTFYDSVASYKPCLLDGEGQPLEIVKRCIDQTACPIASQDSELDESDLLVDWVKVKTQTDNNIVISVEPNTGVTRSITITLVDKQSAYGDIHIIQEGE